MFRYDYSQRAADLCTLFVDDMKCRTSDLMNDNISQCACCVGMYRSLKYTQFAEALARSDDGIKEGRSIFTQVAQANVTAFDDVEKFSFIFLKIDVFAI